MPSWWCLGCCSSLCPFICPVKILLTRNTASSLWEDESAGIKLTNGVPTSFEYRLVEGRQVICSVMGWFYTLYSKSSQLVADGPTGIILRIHPANERRRYIVMSSLIGWAHVRNDPWSGAYLTAGHLQQDDIYRPVGRYITSQPSVMTHHLYIAK